MLIILYLLNKYTVFFVLTVINQIQYLKRYRIMKVQMFINLKFNKKWYLQTVRMLYHNFIYMNFWIKCHNIWYYILFNLLMLLIMHKDFSILN